MHISVKVILVTSVLLVIASPLASERYELEDHIKWLRVYCSYKYPLARVGIKPRCGKCTTFEWLHTCDDKEYFATVFNY